MDKNNLTLEDCLTLAKEFLATKERKNHYDFTAWDDNFGREVNCLNELTGEAVDNLRDLKGKYGEKFVEHLDEVFTDPDVIHDFTGGCEIMDIDLDTVYHKYRIGIHELKSDGTVSNHEYEAVFSDDEYAKLVAYHSFNEHLTMNQLRHYEPTLYERVMDQADMYYNDFDNDVLCVDNPYLVTLDEAKSDFEAIVKQHGITRTTGHMVLVN